MSTTTKRIPKKIQRESMESYVFGVSKSYAAAWSFLGLGASLLMVSAVFYLAFNDTAIALLWFVIAMPIFFGGIGWGKMINRRIRDYKQDILDSIYDEETVTADTSIPTQGTKSVRYTENGVTRDLELPGGNRPLLDSDWQALAHAIIFGGVDISEGSLCRKNKIISQPKYAEFYQYMTQTNKYMELVDGKNKLTQEGTNYIKAYL